MHGTVNAQCKALDIPNIKSAYSIIIQTAQSAFFHHMIKKCANGGHLCTCASVNEIKDRPSLTQSGEVSTHAKLASLMDAFHRLTVGSLPVASSLDLIKVNASIALEVLGVSSDDPGTSSASGMVTRLEKCSSERSLSLPLAATNSLKGRIWNVPSAPSADGRK